MTNADKTLLTGSGSAYTLTVTPTGGHITISVPASVAIDRVGNFNQAAEPLVVRGPPRAVPERAGPIRSGRRVCRSIR